MNVISELSSSYAALELSETYDLFSRIYLSGLTPELLPLIEAIPKLKDTLPDSEHFDFDSASAEHYQIFGLNVFPYQSIFLGPEKILGGEAVERVLSFYQEAGFNFALLDESPDHIGIELSLLDFLCQAESKAVESGHEDVVKQVRILQRRFLDEHLLRWMPVFVQAVRQQGLPFYTVLAELTLEALSTHRALLDRETGAEPVDFILPPAPALLEDEKTGFQDIAEYLLTPVYSGFYLSRDDISRLARSHQLPRGFGSRLQMLTNLIHTAAEYTQLSPLLDDLGDLLGSWRSAYAGWGEQNIISINVVTVWQTRLSITMDLVNQIRTASLE